MNLKEKNEKKNVKEHHLVLNRDAHSRCMFLHLDEPCSGGPAAVPRTMPSTWLCFALVAPPGLWALRGFWLFLNDFVFFRDSNK